MLMTLADLCAAPGMLAWSWTGGPEIVLILVVVLLLFGGRKLPELARGLGRGLRLFKDEVKGVKTDVEDAMKDDDKSEKQEQSSDGTADSAKDDSDQKDA